MTSTTTSHSFCGFHGAQRPISAAGQERQDRARDDRIAGERFDVVLVEAVDEAVELGAKRKQGNRHRRAGDRQRRLADPGKEADGRP